MAAPNQRRTLPMRRLPGLMLIVGLSFVFSQLQADITVVAAADGEKTQSEADKFLFACSGGQEDEVMKMLEEKPELAKITTEDGETCLHLTAISSSIPIAKAVIAAGCDLNARATCEECLRMTPLSWLTYGGKYQLVEILLQAGADINMTFDGFEEGQLFTVMDVAKRFAEARTEETDSTVQDPFLNTLNILKAHGGKIYDEVKVDEEIANNKAGAEL